MKKLLMIITTMALILAIALQGCNSASNEKEIAETSVIEAERDLDNAINDLQAEIQIYRLEVENDFTENNREIADINRKIQNEDIDTRDAHKVRIKELERTNSDLKRQIDNYTHTTEDNWKEFKTDFGIAMDDLENSLGDFFTTATTSIN